MIEVPVLIVGGGGAGVTASMLLSKRGVAEEVYPRGTPAANMSHTAYYAGFAGDDPVYGRPIGRLGCWGAGGLDTDWASASPHRQANLPQIRLEPILKNGAEALAPGCVRFHHELLDLDQDADGVTATVLDKNSGAQSTIRSRYLLACDGGRTVGPKLGVMGTLVPMGPDRWGPDSEEWVFHLNYENQDTRALDDAQVVANMKAALGLPDLDPKVHVVSRWSIEGIVADRFRLGRVFLVDDAAHRHPPTGGLGLTSAIHDAHNLCWKIGAVIGGHAGDALLDSYEPERRSADARNVQRSLDDGMNRMEVGRAIGIATGAGEAENPAALRSALEDGPHRRAVLAAIATQSMEFREHAIEYGYSYTSSAVVDDGTPAPPLRDEIRVYVPGPRPDRLVAWRSLDAVADPATALAAAFSQLLGRAVAPVRA